MTAPELSFAITGAEPARLTAVPALHFELDIHRTSGGPVRSITLTTAIRIAPARRRYERAERDELAELFGAPQRWATTLRPLPWTRLTTVVGPFTDRVAVPLPVACTDDVELAVAKYFHAVRSGPVPLDFLFSGTIFHLGPDERLRTTQIDWSQEATFELAAQRWHEALGDTRWVRITRSSFSRLHDYRRARAFGTWDEAIASLLRDAEQDAS
ncbi:DUF6084 family protein [Saccharopolyspora sp. WRP15-2]|uniref:DUF6084 family protein n=1 Tax=Saccharopolyspora oryzae TaxID=2997343 RepID=A0ABT4UU12_9PSEU|nr:DUF6084 family protein [Saccharopolyspora oryzae]MDA3625213.1 DUF6084 family protein [Saccharopolyspora oryzae]